MPQEIERKFILFKIGSEKAAVFPVPVWALPRTSLPSKRAGIDAAWIGVGFIKLISSKELKIELFKFNWSNRSILFDIKSPLSSFDLGLLYL